MGVSQGRQTDRASNPSFPWYGLETALVLERLGADARLIEEAALAAAEAALTGESVPVSKDVLPLPNATVLADRRNMVFSGTTSRPAGRCAYSRARGRHRTRW